MTRVSLDQERATYAWQVVQGCGKDYVNLAKAAPALIMNNGLMQTLAFYQSKGKEHHKQLASHLMDWLAEQVLATKKDFNSVMSALTEAGPDRFRRATEEALALLRWIRQFAAAVEHKAGSNG